jgi:hypothetical protein
VGKSKKEGPTSVIEGWALGGKRILYWFLSPNVLEMIGVLFGAVRNSRSGRNGVFTPRWNIRHVRKGKTANLAGDGSASSAPLRNRKRRSN